MPTAIPFDFNAPGIMRQWAPFLSLRNADLVISRSLEFLRRLSKEYDRYLICQHQRSVVSFTSAQLKSDESGSGGQSGTMMAPFRLNIIQQMVRATLHMLQFAVAYSIMLLAMYYNGYFIICIIIGAWLGGFVFKWETVSM